jgi:hypothetical protein
VVVFISTSSIHSAYVEKEIKYATQLGAKFVPALLDKHVMYSLSRDLIEWQAFDASRNPASAPTELANLHLTRL